MFTYEMFQVCNHSVLISSLGMGFGHRNCVVVGCPNSGERLNKWAKQTCTVHACLNGTHTCDCEPPFKLFPFPTEKKDSEGRRRWTENIKREIRKGKLRTPNNSSQVCSVHFQDGQPPKKKRKIPTQQRIWDTTSTPKLWEESERTTGSVQNYP